MGAWVKGFVSSTGHLLLTSEAEVHISRSGVTGVRWRIPYLLPNPSARKVRLVLEKGLAKLSRTA